VLLIPAGTTHKSESAAGADATMSWKASTQLMDTIRHYAKFPATGVSLRQMVQFGEKPSTGMSCHAASSLFVMLSHRPTTQELNPPNPALTMISRDSLPCLTVPR